MPLTMRAHPAASPATVAYGEVPAIEKAGPRQASQMDVPATARPVTKVAHRGHPATGTAAWITASIVPHPRADSIGTALEQ